MIRILTILLLIFSCVMANSQVTFECIDSLIRGQVDCYTCPATVGIESVKGVVAKRGGQTLAIIPEPYTMGYRNGKLTVETQTDITRIDNKPTSISRNFAEYHYPTLADAADAVKCSGCDCVVIDTTNLSFRIDTIAADADFAVDELTNLAGDLILFGAADGTIEQDPVFSWDGKYLEIGTLNFDTVNGIWQEDVVTRAKGFGYRLGYENTGNNFSGGAGYSLGYRNTGFSFSGGAGYELGFENTGDRFSGGAGTFLGYQNTGNDFSGGAGYRLGFENTGFSFSGGAGINLGYQNTGSYFSGGAGVNLGFGNTGDNFSGGAGYRLGLQNTGNNFSGNGYESGKWNNRANNSFFGANTDQLSITYNSSSTDLANLQASVSLPLAIGETVSFEYTYYDVSSNINRTRSTFGSMISPPTLQFDSWELQTGDTIVSVELRYLENITAVGANTVADKNNQVALGDAVVDEIMFAERVRLDVFETPQDGYVFVYDAGSGQYKQVLIQRTGSASPVGVVVPDFQGQQYLDTSAGILYISSGITNTSWLQIN